MSGSNPSQTLQKDQQAAALQQIGAVSTLLRKAIQDSLPTSPEQYLTVAIPGTVIDLSDITKGGTFVYDASTNAFPPTQVRQAEAKLVDNMMPLSNIMIGNTGKSVARSYSRALDGLLPVKATVGTADNIRSPGDPAYDFAMDYLTKRDPATGLTPVDIYNVKQEAWAAKKAEWESAKIAAQQTAQALYPPTSDDGSGSYLTKQVQYYADWNQANFQSFKSAVQAKWMDWVTNGNKYNVEYYFGMVDVDSIMARIEASKESMRNSSLVDADGANELELVNLTPKSWATLCKLKADGWYAQNGFCTIGQLRNEIDRLTALQESYSTLQSMTSASPPTYPVNNPAVPTPTLEQAEADVKTARDGVYAAQGKLSGVTSGDGSAEKAALTTAIAALNTAQTTYISAKQAWAAYDVAALQGSNKDSVNGWISATQTTITKQISALQAELNAKLKANPMTLPVITGTEEDDPTKLAIAAPGSELADAMFGLKIDANGAVTTPDLGAAPSTDVSDPWTTVSFSYSAQDQQDAQSSSSWGMSVGGSVGFGLWSAGGQYSHDQSQSDMQSDMSACDVTLSFSSLVVNIDRPWLYGELFNDFELEVANGINLSPGALKLQGWIKNQTQDNIANLAQYSEFPAYPTSFIVAADTVIEFKGSTKHIESHFESQSNSGSVSVGYGPWSVSSSFHQSSSKQSSQMQVTATGCKISFGAPQVIAWVSQILPELPRAENVNPMTQGAGVPVPEIL